MQESNAPTLGYDSIPEYLLALSTVYACYLFVDFVYVFPFLLFPCFVKADLEISIQQLNHMAQASMGRYYLFYPCFCITIDCNIIHIEDKTLAFNYPNVLFMFKIVSGIALMMLSFLN